MAPPNSLPASPTPPRRHPKDDEVIQRLRARLGGARVVDAIGRWRGPGQWKERDVYQIHGMVVHQSLGSGSVTGLALYHTSPGNHLAEEGLPSAAYWAFIDRPSEFALARGERPTLYILNSLSDRTWSHGDRGLPGDENALFLSVCVGGSFRPAGDAEPLPEQVDMLLGVWKVLADLYAWTPATWLGHADLGKSTCPGTALQLIAEAHRAPYRIMAQRTLPLLAGRLDATQRLSLNAEQKEGADLAWQTALHELGFYRGNLDGVWGRRSVEALTRWRRSRLLHYVRAGGPHLARWELDQWVLCAEWRKHRQEAAS